MGADGVMVRSTHKYLCLGAYARYMTAYLEKVLEYFKQKRVKGVTLLDGIGL